MRPIIRFATAGAVAFLGFSATHADAATLATFGDPWGQRATLTNAMDVAFGGGAWTDLDTPADASFLAGESFVYLEGGDSTTDELESFLDANSANIMSWLLGGGSMFINAAPNEGDGLTFGGMSIQYPGNFCSSGCDAVDPLHPIFTGTGTSFSGTFFSHGEVAGGSALITDTGTAGSLLSELSIGAGFLVMGTMTTTNWHTFGDPVTLRANILGYTADAGAAVVPLPAALPLLLGAIGALGIARRRRKAA